MDVLFKKGVSSVKSPVKIIIFKTTSPQQVYPNRMMFVVPKKIFKRANKRNLLKRRMREAFRLNKQLFYERINEREIKCISALIYTGNQLSDYSEIEKAVVYLLSNVVNKIK